MEKQHESGKPIHGTPLDRLSQATPEGGTTTVYTGDLRDVCTLIESPESTKLAALVATGKAGVEVQVPSKDLRTLIESILAPKVPEPAPEESKSEETTETTPEPTKKGK